MRPDAAAVPFGCGVFGQNPRCRFYSVIPYSGSLQHFCKSRSLIVREKRGALVCCPLLCGQLLTDTDISADGAFEE